MRIVAISDTHGFNEKIVVPPGDVLVHAGDMTMSGSLRECAEALDWIESQPHPRKVIIPGNHDWFYQDAQAHIARKFMRTRQFDFLIDDKVIIDGLTFYGSPWQPWFFDWAFNFPEKDFAGAFAREVWSKIPDETNVLITHGPPHTIRDKVFRNTLSRDPHVGCPHLMSEINSRLKNLKLHVFGHIHEGYGRSDIDDKVFVNASICTLKYQPTNEPIVIDL